MGTKCKWVGNIAMNIGDIQCENVTWIYLYEDSPVEGCYGLQNKPIETMNVFSMK